LSVDFRDDSRPQRGCLERLSLFRDDLLDAYWNPPCGQEVIDNRHQYQRGQHHNPRRVPHGNVPNFPATNSGYQGDAD